MSLESLNRLAELSGRTRRTVKDRVKNLTSVKEGRSLLYESTEALPLIYDLGEGALPQKAVTRLNNLKADEISMRLAISHGKYAPLVIISQVIAGFGENANSVLDSLPLRLKKRCPKLTGRDIKFIRREIVKVQNEISRTSIDEQGNIFTEDEE